MEKEMSGFREELRALINRNSMENGSNTPDFILADYLMNCLIAFDKAARRRTLWGNPPDPNNQPSGGPTP